MRSNNYKSVLKHAGLAASVLLLASGAAFGQQQVSLSAGFATAYPSGTPMWGYTCGTAVSGSTATCTALNKAVAAGTAGGGAPAPPPSTGPPRRGMQINPTKTLTFARGNNPPPPGMVGRRGAGPGTPAAPAPGPGSNNDPPAPP